MGWRIKIATVHWYFLWAYFFNILVFLVFFGFFGLFLYVFFTVTPVFAADCGFPVPVEAKIGRHGHEVWHDNTLWTQPRLKGDTRPIQVPTGWVALGADHIQGGCAYFPEEQGVLFINPEHYSRTILRVDGAGFDYVVWAPKATPNDTLEGILQWFVRLTTKALPLFPQGVGQSRQMDVLVTSGMIEGDEDIPENMVFPLPGPHLIVISRPLDGERAHQLLAHTIVHIFNRYHMPPVFTSFMQDELLSHIFYQEMVAAWFEFVTALTRAERTALFNKLWQNYQAAMDGDPATKPTARTLAVMEDFPENPKVTDIHSAQPIKIFYEYYVMPLAALALDTRLRQQNADKGIADMFTDIHNGTYPSFTPALKAYLGDEGMHLMQSWLAAELIPYSDLKEAMERF